MLQQTQRSKSNQQQRSIVALGCCSSIVFHLGLIAGISYWWRSPAAVDEPLEITLVEPNEIESVTVLPSPPLPQPPKISIISPPAQVDRPQPTVLKSVSKPLVVSPAPAAVVAKPISKPTRIAKPTPGSSLTQTKAKPNPRPIQTAQVNPPVNIKPIVNPFPAEPTNPTPSPVQTPLIDPPATKPKPSSAQVEPKTRPRSNSSVNPSLTFPTSPPPKTTTVPTPIQSSIATNSPSIPVKPNFPAAIPKSPSANSPDDPMTSTTTSDLSSPMSPKSEIRSTTSRQPPTGGDIPNNDTNLLSRNLSPSGGLTGNGSRSGSPQAGSPAPGGDSSFSTDRTSRGSGGGGLQCIQHCEIPKLRDLQDRDGGKDRLRIRIVVNLDGSVMEATISKSSDNPQIDAIVLEGIKQMQFRPPGKIIKGIIKANILL
jgi:TonB family protein